MTKQLQHILLFLLVTGPLCLQSQVINTLSNGANTRTEHRVTNSGSTAQGLRIYIGSGNANGNAAFIRLSENRPMRFFTNDLERMRIRSGGNVGIGNNTPQTALHVGFSNGVDGLITSDALASPFAYSFNAGDGLVIADANGTMNQKIEFPNDTNQVLLGNGTFGPAVGGGADDDWYAVSNNAAPASVNDDIYTFGNVGIGTSNPTTDLTVDRPAGGVMSVWTVSNRDGTATANDAAMTLLGGNSGSTTRLTVAGRTAAGQILARRDAGGQGIQLNSSMSGTNGVGIEPIGPNTLYLGGQNILPNSVGTGQNGVNLGNAQTNRSFRYFGVDKNFIIEQEQGNPSLVNSFTIQMGNVRDDNRQGRRGIVIRPSTLINNGGQSAVEYVNTHYLQVCNNQGTVNPSASRTLFTVAPYGWTGIALGGTEVNPVSPACELEVAGDVCANNFIMNSDRRYKQKIRTLDDPLRTLTNLRGVAYRFDQEAFPDMHFDNDQQYGLIAQEVEQVLPELVMTRENGYKAIEYVQLIPLLIEGAKAQQAQIEDLQLELAELKALLATSSPKGKAGDVLQSQSIQKVFLGQNHPNPFNESSRISYFVPRGAGQACIEFRDLNGTLMYRELLHSGKGLVQVQAEGLTGGVYTYSIIIDGEVVESKRMVMTR